MKTWHIAAGALIPAAALALCWPRIVRDPGAARATHAPAPPAIAEARAPAPAPPPPRRVVAARAPAAAPDGDAPRPEPSSAPRPQRTGRETAADMEAAFATQTIDRGWSREAEGSLSGKLQPALPEGSSLRSTVCRESLCRIETSHHDRAAYRQFLGATFMNADAEVATGPWFATVVDEDDSGGVTTVAFLARPGTQLPL